MRAFSAYIGGRFSWTQWPAVREWQQGCRLGESMGASRILVVVAPLAEMQAGRRTGLRAKRSVWGTLNLRCQERERNARWYSQERSSDQDTCGSVYTPVLECPAGNRSVTLSGHCVGMGKLRPAIRTETSIGVVGIGVVGIGLMLTD